MSLERSGLEMMSRNHGTGKRISCDDIISPQGSAEILTVRFSIKHKPCICNAQFFSPDSPAELANAGADADAGKPRAVTSI